METVTWIVDNWKELAFVLAVLYAIVQKVKAVGGWQTVLDLANCIEAGEDSSAVKDAAIDRENPLINLAAAIADPKKAAVLSAAPRVMDAFKVIARGIQKKAKLKTVISRIARKKDR